jgi:hypothetical protein
MLKIKMFGHVSNGRMLISCLNIIMRVDEWIFISFKFQRITKSEHTIPLIIIIIIIIIIIVIKVSLYVM